MEIFFTLRPAAGFRRHGLKWPRTNTKLLSRRRARRPHEGSREPPQVEITFPETAFQRRNIASAPPTKVQRERSGRRRQADRSDVIGRGQKQRWPPQARGPCGLRSRRRKRGEETRAPGMWALEKSPHPSRLQSPQLRDDGFGQEIRNVTPRVTFWEMTPQHGDRARLRESSPAKFQFLGGSLKRGHDCGRMLEVFQGSQREAMFHCFGEDGLIKNMTCFP